MRYEPTDFEWAAIRWFPPNNPHVIARVDERCVLNGIFFIRMIAFDKARAAGAARSRSPQKADR